MEAARFQDEQKVVITNEDTVFMAKSALYASNTDTLQASSVGVTLLQSKELGEDISVVSTYDGEWHPTDGVKK